MKKETLITLLCISLSHFVNADLPAREINCFRNFDVSGAGRRDINAYLLMVLSQLVYADKLSLETGFTSETSQALGDPNLFKNEFIKRTKHFFYDPALPKSLAPQYDFVTASNNRTIDSEVMLISTSNAVYVVARGTDRVMGADSDWDYDWGEWLGTDLRFLFHEAYPGSKEKVHRGFYNSVHYTPGTPVASVFQNEPTTPNSYINTLISKVKAMVGRSNKKVWITGHSLGSAVAQVIGFYLMREDVDVQGMILFAAPHPGDWEFCNTLNQMFAVGNKSGARIQRYDFIEDPVTKLAGRDMCAPVLGCYGHAGVRNQIHFARPTAIPPDHIEFDVGERLVDVTVANASGLITGKIAGFGGACWHHQEWYTNACFYQLTPSQQAVVPLPPYLPTSSSEGCTNNQYDIALGTSGNYLDAGSAVMVPGTYTIRNAKTGKFIIASTRNCGFLNNCCPAIPSSTSIGTNDDKWILASFHPIFQSYILTSKSRGTVLDADAVCGNSNGCKVQTCNRIPEGAGFRTNQEWAFQELSPNRYKVRCAAGDKYLTTKLECAGNNDCDFNLLEAINNPLQEFIFTRSLELPDGVYKIRANKATGTASTPYHYLDLDNANDGNEVRINSNAPSGNKWKVTAIANGVTIRNVTFNTYLDADYLFTDDGGCKVQGWRRTTGGILADTRNQEWLITVISIAENNYRCKVTNVKSPQMFLDSNDNATGNTPVVLYHEHAGNHSQEFIFEKQ